MKRVLAAARGEEETAGGKARAGTPQRLSLERKAKRERETRSRLSLA